MYEDQFEQHEPVKTQRNDRPFLATINNTVTADGDDVWVTVPGIDGGEARWGPVRWSPRPGPSGTLIFPAEGQEALVQYDDFHNLWMYLWWPYA